MTIIPATSDLTRPFWEGLARGEILVRRCLDCGCAQHPPVPRCVACHGEHFEWVALSGDATLYSYTVAIHAAHHALADRVPYVVALVDTAEGHRMVCDVLDCAPDAVRVGMAVRLSGEPVAPGIGLLHARPASDPGSQDGEPTP